jgi:hypothetical protein
MLKGEAYTQSEGCDWGRRADTRVAKPHSLWHFERWEGAAETLVTVAACYITTELSLFLSKYSFEKRV